MRITLRQSFKARAADLDPPDMAVFFDVFRASTTLAALIGQKPQEILSTNDRLVVEGLVADGYVLVSEVFQGGLDNSPTQVLAAGLEGKRIVHKSTNLTAAIFHNLPVRRILIAGFCNLNETAAAILASKPGSVELIPAGHFHKAAETDEDSGAAEAMAAALRGEVQALVPHRAAIEAKLSRLKDKGGLPDHYFDDAAAALTFGRFPYVVEARCVSDGLIELRSRWHAV